MEEFEQDTAERDVVTVCYHCDLCNELWEEKWSDDGDGQPAPDGNCPKCGEKTEPYDTRRSDP